MPPSPTEAAHNTVTHAISAPSAGVAVKAEAPPPEVTYAGQVTTSTSTTTTTTSTTTTSTVPPTTRPAITAPDDSCSVTLLADAFFESGGSTLSAEAGEELVTRVSELSTCITSTALIKVEAWTDDRGDDDYNLELSNRRVDAAVAAIVGEWPDLAERIIPIGHGEADSPTPCTGDCPANRVVTVAVEPDEAAA